MKHGVTRSIDHTPPMSKKTFEAKKVLGIPTRVDLDSPLICHHEGIFNSKRIVVGKTFFYLPYRQQFAVLMHEAGHCMLNHSEEKMKAIILAVCRHPLLWMKVIFAKDEDKCLKSWDNFLEVTGLRQLSYRHEFEADRYAGRSGFAADLVAFFRTVEEPTPEMKKKVPVCAPHPPKSERINRLVQEFIVEATNYA